MNGYIFYLLINKWIPLEERIILSKKDTWLMGIYKKNKNKSLNLDIKIHTGSPCFRYCVCKYFLEDERLDYLERGDLIEYRDHYR